MITGVIETFAIFRLYPIGQGWENSGPRAKYGPPQRFQWPAEAFSEYVQIWIFPPIYHSRC